MATRMLVVAVLTTMTMTPIGTLGSQISVTVRNEPIQAAGTIENGHILLPLRATFESLNSSVWYDADAGSIEARNILHVLRLKIDSKTAYLDGHAVRLETPPRVIKGRVYIPVAFAAEAMGAIVRYDPHANVLAINGSQPVPTDLRNVHDATHEPADLSPAPNSTVQTEYPIVSASLGGAIAASNAVALSVDGNDVTSVAAFDGHAIRYTPQLAPGRHTVAFSARTAMGRTVSTQWSFITVPAFGANAGFGATPAFGFGFGPSVVGNGITIIAPPAGTGFAQPCGPVVVQPWWPGGWRASLPCATFGTANGNSGLYLTGDPIMPFGQTTAAPVFPVFVPRRSFQTIFYPPASQTIVHPNPFPR